MTNHLAVDVVKRSGKRPTEKFQADKLRSSLIASCLSVQTPQGQAEKSADLVVHSVTVWLDKKSEVTSADLRRIAARHLKTYHQDAAYIYETYHHTI